MEALDQAGGDVVGALALLERRTEGLSQFQEQVKEGVTRGLSGEQLSAVRWRLSGQVMSEVPTALVGVAAVVVGVLAVLISSSTIETDYAAAAAAPEDGASDGPSPSTGH